MDDIELIKPVVNSNGTFENPFETWKGLPRTGSFFQFMWDRMTGRREAPTKAEYEENLPVIKPDTKSLQHPPPDKLQYVWIGHATVLYQTGGWNILSDPIWSDRCSPINFMGPKRYRPPPLTIQELPEIDAVVISHNHYDHLDKASVKELNQRFGTKLHWYVPQGLQSWFISMNVENVTQLSWWESHTLTDQSALREPLKITCTPAQHWSLRNGCDRNVSLWSSWVLKSSKHSIWFSGDTGYCEVFQKIGQRLGPFDLAAIAIGAYCPRYFMQPQHIDPQQALLIHTELRSKLSIGIHWGTFPMGSTEPYMEPKQLIEQLQKDQEGEYPFITVAHGSVNIADD